MTRSPQRLRPTQAAAAVAPETPEAKRTVIVVAAVAVLAALMRFPSWLWPIRPDEAGFTLVARELAPTSDHLFGPHFVDRPPPIIGLIRLSDAIGGPMFVRVLAMVACALLVVIAARTAYLLGGLRAARWTALGTMAMTTNPMIDAVAAKGEVLGIPVVLASCLLAIEALRLEPIRPRAALLAAAAAGGCGMLAIGFKQNMMSGLIFGGVLLIASVWRRELAPSTGVRLAVAAAVGAAIPLGLTIAWTVGHGVELQVLWDTVFGFRSKAIPVIDVQSAPMGRRWRLLTIAFLTGIGVALLWFVVNIRSSWSRHAPVVLATIALASVDVAGVALGGSFWRTYLLGLIPAAALALALTTGLPGLRGRVARGVVVFAVVSALLAAIGWTRSYVAGSEPPGEIYTGRAIAAASEPGDSIVTFGGRPDIVMASGLTAPYEHLWSLPTRVLDPDLGQLTALLESPERPTWFVEASAMSGWTGTGMPLLEDALERYYEPHGTACNDTPIYLARGLARDFAMPDCDAPWHKFTLFGEGF